jgi:hypothetical protein
MLSCVAFKGDSKEMLPKLIVKVSVAGLVSAGIAGCSTFTDKQTQEILVKSLPSGATCTLKNNEGTYTTTETPAKVIVNTSCEPIEILCKKEGYFKGYNTAENYHKSSSFGNVALLGPITYEMDRINGAACEYPPVVSVYLKIDNSNPFAGLTYGKGSVKVTPLAGQ